MPVKLPLNNDYSQKIVSVNSLIKNKEIIPIKFMNWNLFYYDLDKIGYPIKLYSVPLGIFCNFISKQYEYNKCKPILRADKGEIVIDAGGCWGDTALYFAHRIQEEGKVYTFEFMPSNLEIMEKNFDLNPELRKRIEIIKNPVWDKPDEIYYCSDNGPASNISNIKCSPDDYKIITISIDDFVEKNHIKKIDFIKLDIEGAELNALIGAENTIRKFRPKLAIAVYHKLSDFTTIPQFISTLDLNYDIFLSHHTDHIAETVLYANPRN